MNIYIPTYNRPYAQPAYWQLRAAKLPVVLLVDKRDKNDYSQYEHMRGPFTDLRGKELWLARRHHERGDPYMQVDDDLVLCTAYPGQRIEEAPSYDVRAMVKQIKEMLAVYAQVGVHHAFMVNYADKPYQVNKGQFPFRVRAYNPSLWRRLPRPCPGVDGHNDVWMWHELVRQGLPYAIVTQWCHRDKLYKAKRTHFAPDFKDKAAEFNTLIDLAGIDRTRFTIQRKNGVSLAYAKLAKHYCSKETT